MLSALRNFALTFLISALIFGCLAYFIVGFVLETLSLTISAEVNTPGDTLELVDPEDTKDPENSGLLFPDDEINGDTFNILLVGTDYQPELFDDYHYEENWEGTGFPDKRSRPYSADMIIIMRIDKEKREFIFSSIPRNTRLTVNGADKMIADIYCENGIEYLSERVSGLTGLDFDYYAILDVGAIAECVDILGGVTYYVPEDMSYEDPEQDLVIDLKRGTTLLDGEKAAQLLRYKGYENGSTGRMNTAIGFVQAMFGKFTNITYLSKAPELFTSLEEHLSTNFTMDDLINNLDLIFAYSKFEAKVITYPGSPKMYDGVSYFEPALTAAMKLYENYR